MQPAQTARLWLPLALLAVAGLLGSGCWSFGNVSSAAALGQLVGKRAEATAALPIFCEATNIFAGPQPSCQLAEVERATQELLHYSQSLARYATMLRNVADFNDPRPREPLAELELGLARAGELPPLPRPGDGGPLAAAATEVVSKLSQPWRRRQLEQLVQATQPHLLVLTDQLLMRVTLLGESLRDLATGGLDRRRTLLADIDAGPPGAAPLGGAAGRLARQVDRLALLHFRLLAQRSLDGLAAYQKSLRAFQRAHTILYEISTTHTTGLVDSSDLTAALSHDLPPLLR